MFTKKTIFVSPLDWGLGHATRCVPLIRELEKNNTVIVGTVPSNKNFFEREFPHLETTDLPAYNISYSTSLPLWLKLLIDWRKIRAIIRREHRFLDGLILRKKIDVVISDSRFGLYSSHAHCVFVTHQLFLKSPVANSIAQSVNKKYISRFNEVWVPDYPEIEKSLSGDLSHGKHYHKNVKYIGPVSRLDKLNCATAYDAGIILSGPQPMRGIFCSLLQGLARNYPEKRFAMVTPDKTDFALPNMEIFVSPNAEQLSKVICSSHKIICRSGYSTLMDLYALGKKDIMLVPTPGQTEQEYLGKYWEQHFGCKLTQQKNIPDLKL